MAVALERSTTNTAFECQSTSTLDWGEVWTSHQKSGLKHSHCSLPTQTMVATSSDPSEMLWAPTETEGRPTVSARGIAEKTVKISASDILCMWTSAMLDGTTGLWHLLATRRSTAKGSAPSRSPTIWIPQITRSCRLWSTRSARVWRRKRAVCPLNCPASACCIWTTRTRWCWKTIRTWLWWGAVVGNNDKTIVDIRLLDGEPSRQLSRSWMRPYYADTWYYTEFFRPVRAEMTQHVPYLWYHPPSCTDLILYLIIEPTLFLHQRKYSELFFWKVFSI